MNINATSSVSLTLLAAGHWHWPMGWWMQAVLWYRPRLQDQKLLLYFCFCFQISENLHPCLIIRWWWSWWRSVSLSWCWPREHRRRVTVTETKEWAKDIPVNDKCPHNGPLRLNSTMPALHQDTLARGQRNPLSSHWPQGPRGGFWLANLLPRPAPMFTLTRSLNSEPGSDHHKHFPSGSKFCLTVLLNFLAIDKYLSSFPFMLKLLQISISGQRLSQIIDKKNEPRSIIC